MQTRMAGALQKPWFRSASLALAILAFINLFNYLDRYVVSALVESLKHSELNLSDAQLGSLMSGFVIVFAVIAPIFGVLGDRRSRTRLIAFGVGCWSVATALSGFAGISWRCSRPVPRSASARRPMSRSRPSLLSDYFPRGQRGRVMAIFFCAIPVGSALGFVVGGLIDVHFGWRVAFFVAGVPGLILAVLCLGLRDPPRGSQDPELPADRPSAPRAVAHYAGSAAQQTLRAHDIRIRRLHIRARRPRLLDACVSRTRARDTAR